MQTPIFTPPPACVLVSLPDDPIEWTIEKARAQTIILAQILNVPDFFRAPFLDMIIDELRLNPDRFSILRRCEEVRDTFFKEEP
jgi:hypothetical protein